jgi:hypothetical protein
VVLAPAASDAVALTGSSAAVYMSLDAPCTDGEVLDALANLGADAVGVDNALRMLRDAGLVEEVRGGS